MKKYTNKLALFVLTMLLYSGAIFSQTGPVSSTASYKFVPNLSPSQIYGEIISQSLNQIDINILVEMYSMIWSANDQAFNSPPANSTRAMGRTSLFFWQKNSIASALKAYEDTFNHLGSSIGITGKQFKLAIGIQEVIVPQACPTCDPAYKSLKTHSEDPNTDMVFRGMSNWAQFSKNPGFKSTPEGNAHPHYELSMGSFFDYYTKFIPAYYLPKSIALQQKGQIVESQIAVNVDKEEKYREWLNSPEGRKFTANQELKAQRDRSTAQTKLATEFPYYAIFTCSVGATGGQGIIEACFSARSSTLNTQLELRNGSDYGLYQGFELSKIGEVTPQGFVINLRDTFTITAQNSSSVLTLGLKIYDRASNKLLFNKQAALWGVIKVKN